MPDDSSRVHRTWYPSDVRPDANASASASVGRRSAAPADSVGIHAGSRLVLVAAVSSAVSRLSRRATAPAVAEHAAPMTRVPVSPKSSMRTRPAANVPRIAPSVFAAYSRPNAADRWRSRLSWRVSVGSVAPISTVAGARASTASANRIRASTTGWPSIEGKIPR